MVVFEGDDDTLYWLPGHIEKIAVVRGTMNLSSISNEQLQTAEKDPVSEVSIDDPRAAFLFRWYVEVDKTCADLEGYQNKVNDAEPLRGRARERNSPEWKGAWP